MANIKTISTDLSYKSHEAFVSEGGRVLRDLAYAIKATGEAPQAVFRRWMDIYLQAIIASIRRKHASKQWSKASFDTRRFSHLLKRGGKSSRLLKYRIRNRAKIGVEGKLFVPYTMYWHNRPRPIRQKRTSWLAIPLPDALRADGTPKKSGPRSWKNTILQKRKDTLYIVQRKGSKRNNQFKFLYVLKKQVIQKPKFDVYKIFFDERKRLWPEIISMIEKYVRKVTGKAGYTYKGDSYGRTVTDAAGHKKFVTISLRRDAAQGRQWWT